MDFMSKALHHSKKATTEVIKPLNNLRCLNGNMTIFPAHSIEVYINYS